MKLKLKILHLSSEKTWRGGEQQIAYLIDELNAMDVENLVAARAGSAFEKHCQSNAIKMTAFPFKNSFDVTTALGIKHLCTTEQIDLIHLHSAKSHAIGVLSAMLGNKKPLILSRRVDFVPKRNMLTRLKYNHNAIKRIVGVSDKITSIMKNYVKNPSLCITVHSGVDLEKFGNRPAENSLRKEFNIAGQTMLIGNTSALEGHKDYFTFIETIKKLAEAGIPVKAFIIGDGSQKERLQEFVKQKELTAHVIFTGFRKDIIRILPDLDLFLMTSNEEGLGTSVLDAFLAKVPVVATKAGGIPEMVIHEKTGMLAPVGDAGTLADHIKRVFHDNTLRDRIIGGASEKVSEFSKELTAKKTLAVYREVLAAL
jgi:L-malate glycosyltransferase